MSVTASPQPQTSLVLGKNPLMVTSSMQGCLSRDVPLALHEAGHIVACLEFGYTVEKASIREAHSSGVVSWRAAWITDPRQDAIITAAGTAAEKLNGRAAVATSTEDGDELQLALSRAKVPAENTIPWLEDIFTAADELVARHAAKVDVLAKALLYRGTLDSDRIKRILASGQYSTY